MKNNLTSSYSPRLIHNFFIKLEAGQRKQKMARYKVIINKPATVLIDTFTNKKYVSKCSPEDTFNPEIGLMMCFTKAMGFNYHDFMELLNGTQEYKEEPALVTEPVSDTTATKFGFSIGEKVLKSAPVAATLDSNKTSTKPVKRGRSKKPSYYVQKVKGRNKGQYLLDYDVDTLEVTFDPGPAMLFNSSKEAQEIIDALDLKDVVILELTDKTE